MPRSTRTEADGFVAAAPSPRISRRRFLVRGLAAVGGGVALSSAACRGPTSPVFIGMARDYGVDLSSVIFDGLREIGIGQAEMSGASVLLKPNLVETSRGSIHINTHPLVVRGAIEAFLRLGVDRVLVAEGAGHQRDSYLVLEESGMGEVLQEDKVPFVDLNYDTGVRVPNLGDRTTMGVLTLPETLTQVDWIVSMPKMKTHHWVGVTLSMKNLFGVMPGFYYGWPKNLLHHMGIENSILDINATVKPHLAIVDGIVGMEGDGPIMGDPRPVGALILGRSLPAVDATCARVMGIRPERISYLAEAHGWLGTIGRWGIEQRGETVESVRTPFALLDSIPAHQGLR